MALLIHLETDYGEERELYVRVNNYDQLTNHDEAGPDVVRFRGYISQAAFEQRKGYVWEFLLPCSIGVGDAPHPQAYAALKAHDPTLAIAPMPPAPDPLPEPTPEDPDVLKRMAEKALCTVEALQAAQASTEARYADDLAEHEAAVAAAVKLRDALAAASDV